MPTGRVSFFNEEKGYGFIDTDERDEDVFVHITAVPGQQDLEEGQDLEFEIAQGERGPRAENVRLV